MSDPRLPRCPRFAAHALGRRHVVDGEERVAVHDALTGRLVMLGAHAWTLLSCADGTRDLDGIVAAGARHGAHALVGALRTFLEQLYAVGLIVDGMAEDEPTADVASTDGASGTRPLDPLAGFLLQCDGTGSCCRIYSTLVFSPLETARARAALPRVLDAGELPERAFLPERGAGPSAAAAVVLVDGRCAYLTDAGRCGIHEAAGAPSKPAGCQLFPALFVDDGEAVRVSPAVECSCVLASVGRGVGTPLVPAPSPVRSGGRRHRPRLRARRRSTCAP